MIILKGKALTLLSHFSCIRLVIADVKGTVFMLTKAWKNKSPHTFWRKFTNTYQYMAIVKWVEFSDPIISADLCKDVGTSIHKDTHFICSYILTVQN